MVHVTQCFWTADLHFDHANIIKYCDRPFADVDEMNEGLVQRWNAVVSPGDRVTVLGDFSLSTKSLHWVRKLNGRKVLVAGNHDRCWEPRLKSEAALNRMLETYHEAGFETVIPRGILRGQSLFGRGRLLTVDAAHLPYAGDSHDEDRYAARRPADRGRWLLCGHVHENWRVFGRQINVGVDVWGYAPVHESVLCELIMETV